MEVPNIFIHGIDYHILYLLPAEYVLNMCQVNKPFSKICDDEFYWIVKFRYEYSEYIEEKPFESTWKQFYLDLAKNKLKKFPIYFESKIVSHVWFRNTNTERKAKAAIKQLFDLLYPEENPYFIHVLLNNLKRFDSNNRAAKFLPIIRQEDFLLDEITPEYGIILWNNMVGFEIIKGQIAIGNAREINESPFFLAVLPGVPRFKSSYNHADL